MNKRRSECEANIKNERNESDDFNTQIRYYRHVNNTQKNNKKLKN